MTEKRREERSPAEGIVELETPEHRRITGFLVDVSNSGLRVRHEDLSLATGHQVRFSHAGGSGTAMVIWTRVFNRTIESGLHVLRPVQPADSTPVS
jgi:hypothetical protein